MEHKLHVKGLTISFKTREGTVHAVRNIDFDLNQGETLAIVGESGSGKSVTSKAILGILAGNSIVESGEIIYDGKDLLKISEDEFHKIRGDKIAMIFQDPMSSLNPISKVGKQLTEAMILKGKARQKESRNSFNTYLGKLNAEMNGIITPGEATRKCKDFDKFEYKHLDLESAYNRAYEAAEEAITDIDALAFELEKKGAKDVVYRVKRIRTLALDSIQKYVVNEDAEALKSSVSGIVGLARAAKNNVNTEPLISALNAAGAILKKAVAFEKPNFFALGYYVTFSNEPVPDIPVDELNRRMRKYLDDNFMLDFIDNVKLTLEKTAKRSAECKKKAIEVLESKRDIFTAETLDKEKSYAALKEMSRAVTDSIDTLAIVKDSVSYTFSSGFRSELDKYFYGKANNGKEQKRYDRQTAKQDRMRAKGQEPNWVVAAPALVDFELVKSNLQSQIDRVISDYTEKLNAMDSRNFTDEAVAVIDYLKSCASGVVLKVTKHMAKNKAIKLMEEVGISEPRKRYNQYPFEFSGGMRQRIVIAIALAANPDILICDEPTTALDVTIQSQILELINKLKAERHLSVIFITHDLGVVANMADRIAVMYAGKIVEYGTSSDIFYHSAHPYTWALLSSMPDLDTNEKLDAIPGTPPDMRYPPVGDAFAERNKYALKIDFERQPPMFRISDTHYAATWLLHPSAPKVEPPKAITDRINRMKQKREAHADGE